MVPGHSTVSSISLVGFRVTCMATAPQEFMYAVTAAGPAELVDKGDPAALGGTTPILAPGETWYPPEAGLIIPKIRNSEVQTVTYRVWQSGEYTWLDSCQTVITIEPPVATFITSFDATAKGATVELAWDLLSDDVIGEFRLGRGGAAGPLTDMGIQLPADTRRYIDASVPPGETYSYELTIRLDDGSELRSQRVSARVAAPRLALLPGQPNPFSQDTRIRFELDGDRQVVLRVYDVSGRLIRTLADGHMSIGPHERLWNGRDDRGQPVASGIYFYRLIVDDELLTRKGVLIR